MGLAPGKRARKTPGTEVRGGWLNQPCGLHVGASADRSRHWLRRRQFESVDAIANVLLMMNPWGLHFETRCALVIRLRRAVRAERGTLSGMHLCQIERLGDVVVFN